MNADPVEMKVKVNVTEALAQIDAMQRALKAAQAPVSPARSFAGYSVRTWLSRNKGSIKFLEIKVTP